MSYKLSQWLTAIAMTLFAFQAYADSPDQGHGHGHDQEQHAHHEGDHHGADGHHDDHGEFNPGEMIFDHILDSHEIHFFTLGEGTDHETHISIYLPVILYTEDRGVEVFMSSKFDHHTHTYDRYHVDGKEIYYVNEAGEKVYPLDFSITKTVVGMFIVVLIMFLIFPSAASAYKKRQGQAPKGLQSVLEPIIIFVRDEVAKPAIGDHKYERFLPFLLSIFFFIWISNILGLIPFIGGFNIMGQISVTLALAAFTFIVTTVNGNRHYWSHIFAMPGVPPAILFILTPIEILGMFTKPIVLMIRLFANITAGHMIILAFVSLIFLFNNMYGVAGGAGVSILSLFFAMFMNVIEILVAFLQAFVFTLLSALYFGSAVEEAHH